MAICRERPPWRSERCGYRAISRIPERHGGRSLQRRLMNNPDYRNFDAPRSRGDSSASLLARTPGPPCYLCSLRESVVDSSFRVEQRCVFLRVAGTMNARAKARSWSPRAEQMNRLRYSFALPCLKKSTSASGIAMTPSERLIPDRYRCPSTLATSFSWW